MQRNHSFFDVAPHAGQLAASTHHIHNSIPHPLLNSQRIPTFLRKLRNHGENGGQCPTPQLLPRIQDKPGMPWIQACRVLCFTSVKRLYMIHPSRTIDSSAGRMRLGETTSSVSSLRDDPPTGACRPVLTERCHGSNLRFEPWHPKVLPVSRTIEICTLENRDKR